MSGEQLQDQGRATSLYAQECCPSKLQVVAWSIIGALIFEWSWWITGGGYGCSVPIFLALFLHCYGRQLLSASIFRVLARNAKSNMQYVWKEERSSAVLMMLYFALKCGLMVVYPEGEMSNGSPLSLITFTVLFISIFLIQFLNKMLSSGLPSSPTVRNKETVTTAPHSWKKTALFYVKAVGKWKASVLICLAVVIISYAFDSNITALVRFVGKGRPCWPVLKPKNPEAAIPSSILNAYPWHTVYPTYHPAPLLKAFILIGRELGEVCHLLPMLIGVYTLSQIFLPPNNSVIKKALFASIAGVVLGGVTSGCFKVVFHRYRPNAYGDPYMWKGPSMTTVNHLKFSKLDLSFPAGHTTVTTAVATCWYVFSRFSFKQLCISPCFNMFMLLCFYVNPLLVLVSRVSECYHWTSDATFGVSTCMMELME